MESVTSFLKTLASKGVKLSADAGQLNCYAQKGALTDEIRDSLTRFKSEIIALLEDGQNLRQAQIDNGSSSGSKEFPLSAGEKGLYILQKLRPEMSAYNVPLCFRINSELNAEILAKAWEHTLEQFPILTARVIEKDGDLYHRLDDSCKTTIQRRSIDFADDRQLLAFLRERMREQIDLNRGPLARIELFTQGERKSILLIIVHHIVFDGASAVILLKSFFSFYRQLLQGEPVRLSRDLLGYQEFVAWEKAMLASAEGGAHAAYWRRRLADELPIIGLLPDLSRSASPDFEEKALVKDLPEDLSRWVRDFAKARSYLTSVIFLGVFQLLLHRYANQDDIIVGMPVMGRAAQKFAAEIGYFINMVPLRARFEEPLKLSEFLRRTQRVMLDALHHSSYPFPLMVEKLKTKPAGKNPVYQVTYAYQNFTNQAGVAMLLQQQSPNLEIEYVTEIAQEEDSDLELEIFEKEALFSVRLKYNPELYSQDAINRFFEHYCALLKGISENQDLLLHEYSVLTESEKHRLLVDYNDTRAEYPKDKCLHELFVEQVARNGEKTAVVCGEERLTYRELHARSQDLALYLQLQGVGPDRLVGLCMDRSLEMVVGLLGILQAGGAYVPLDPGYPDERLAYMLRDSRAAIVLTQEKLEDKLGGLIPAEARLISLDRQWLEIGDRVAGLRAANVRLQEEVRPYHLAYVIYTSGSTGQPKGVAIEHHSPVTLAHWAREVYGPEDWAGVLASTSICFDLSVYEIFVTLANGGTIILASDALGFINLTNKKMVTLINTVPSAMEELVRQGAIPDSVQTINLAGEPLSRMLVDKIYDTTAVRKVYDLYGPSEDTTYSTYLLRKKNGPQTIGRPIANTQVYILDQHNQVQPIGAPGELHLAGEGLARGYLNRPELTEEKFVANPFEPGARMYKTGDLARWMDDGSIQYLGRIDAQVKIRGFRIELGEIEARLNERPEIQDSAVIARGEGADKQLIAFYRAKDTTADEIVHLPYQELRAHLLRTLPEYMAPAAFVSLAAIPLSPNGKVDRRALARMDVAVESGRKYLAPRNETEKRLVEIWAEVLNLAPEKIGVNDNFFELGGHSLLAITMVERMRREGLMTDIRSLLTAPTLGDLAEAVGGGRPEIEIPPNLIPAGCRAITPEMLPLIELTQEEIDSIVAGTPGGAANVKDIYPLAPLQEGILFHHLMNAEGDTYLLHGLLAFDTRGRLDGFNKALGAVIARHDMLRTSVVWENLPEPAQVVWREAPLVIEEVELDPGEGEAPDQLLARFDPRRIRIDVRQAPLMRCIVAHDAANGRWLLLWLFHHLTVDHTTMEIMIREAQAVLVGEIDRLPEPLPFRNFVAQARLGISQAEHEAFFREMLNDVDEPTAPFGLLDAQSDGLGIEEAEIELEATLGQRLRGRARLLGVSAASLCHLAWALALGRVSSRDDVVFGTVIFGRMQGGEGADRALGVFINTLPIRIRAGKESVEQSVRQTHALLAGLMRHEHASLALAQRCSGVAMPAPLFSSLLNYRHSSRKVGLSQEAELAWTGIEPLGFGERTNYPLTLSIDDLGDGFTLTAQTVAPIDPGRVCDFMRTALDRLVEALEMTPERAVSAIDVMPEAERRQALVEWNATERDYPAAGSWREKRIHELFEQQVEKSPGATALVYEEQSLTYSQLNARANQLAHHLRELGVGPDSQVAICLERSIEMVVALLATLKAGGAYIPLDPAYPPERLAYMLEDSQAPVLITQRSRIEDRGSKIEDSGSKIADFDPLSSILDPRVQVIYIDSDWELIERESAENPTNEATADNLAYVIYTSGSTGRPKGALVSHANVVRLFSATQDWYHFDERDVWTLFHSYAFDFSVWELWGALLYGGRLVVVPYWVSRSPEAFHELLRCEQVTVLNQTPSAFRQLIRAEEQAETTRELALRLVIFGGEALELQSLKPWFDRHGDERPQLVNMYGITETTVHVSYRPVRAADLEDGKGSVIGGAIPDLRICVLDAKLRPAPIGVAGEMYVGGAGVARGYLNRPELTAERFIPDPFGAEPGAWLYRTGDLARYLADGDLEYLGRIDHQVKIRGFRIELGEIEAKLSDYPGAREAVVLALDDGERGKRLVAYYTGEEIGAGALRAHLSSGLPEYMVPSAYVHLETLPLTPNGKLDRRALPAPDGHAYAGRGYEPPVGEIETRLARIWAEALKLERVGRHDNFLELGGHSLLAIRVIERMRREGLPVDVRMLFTASTLQALAEALATALADGSNIEIETPPNLIPQGCRAITPEMLPLVELTQPEIDSIVARVPGGAANVQDIYPLAPLQEGILFHHLMGAEGDVFLLPILLAFDTRERLNNFISPLQAVIARHDILRTSVMWEGLPEPVQVVWREAPLAVEEIELDPSEGEAAEQLWARFDPTRIRLDVRRAPLMRYIAAYDAANGRWLMQCLHHHLVIDHTNIEIMTQEAQLRLQGEIDQLPEPLPFRNFVAQARLGIGQAEHEAFFRAMLNDVDEPTAPFGLLDAHGDGSGIEEVKIELDSSLAGRVRERARALGVNTASLYHVAWARALGRVSNRDDVVFGTMLFGRMQGGEGADRTLGLFINTLPIRIRAGEESVEQSVRQTHALLAGLMRHEHASLALAQRCSGVAAPAPLFSSVLNYRHSSREAGLSPETTMAWEGIEILDFEELSNYPLTVAVDDFGDGFEITTLAVMPIDPGRVCEYLRGALEGVVEALEREPGKAVRTIEVMPEAELRQLLVEWNETEADYPAAGSWREKCIHELFEEQVERSPEAVAVVFEDQELTYRELNARANRLARSLVEQGVGPEVLVALLADRGIDFLIAMLAIFKAGGAYLPLDPRHPVQRIAQALNQSRAAFVITAAPYRELAAEATASSDAENHSAVFFLDDLLKELRQEENLSIHFLPNQLAYVIYTSGSTGAPKGAMIEHRGMINHLFAKVETLRLTEKDIVAQTASQCFDISVWQFLAALLVGGQVQIFDDEIAHNPASLLGQMELQGITILETVPSIMRIMLTEADHRRVRPDLSAARWLIPTGEALPPDLCRHWFDLYPEIPLLNAYGPTECSDDVTHCPIEKDLSDSAMLTPIGRPIANMQIYVLNPELQPQPIGVVGELCVGGEGVGRGYLNEAGKTSELFIPAPFAMEAGQRLYKTGDLARFLPDGNLEYLSRIDHQVKIRGFRIELGEIEAALHEHGAVEQAVVLMREDQPGAKRLVAYVVKADIPEVSHEEELNSSQRTIGKEQAPQWSEFLSDRLPAYMVPTVFVELEKLPLTTNGKLDRRALARMDVAMESGREYLAPRNETERRLVEIWAEALNLAPEKIGVNDNFFELGGHSLLAIKVIERIRQEGLHSDVRAIFAAPTPAEFAAAMEDVEVVL